MRKPVKPKWAAMIAKIFKAMPTICPKCGTAMDLKEFILDEKIILEALPQTARAPPQKHFESHPVGANAIAYVPAEDSLSADELVAEMVGVMFDKLSDSDAGFSQAREYER